MIFCKNNPFHSKIKDRYFLTKNSTRTCHVVLDLDNQSFPFEVGDSVGVLPQNDPHLVKNLLNALNASGEESIVDKRSQKIFQVSDFLLHKTNLGRSSSAFFKKALEHGSADLHHFLEPEKKTALAELLHSHEPAEILALCGAKNIPLQEILDLMAPLLPRFYSIASSPNYHEGEIHLTVTSSSYEYKGQTRFGIASHFLCERASFQETPIPIFIQNAPHFRLPENEQIPIIMIGPGTGVAPFRAFLQERLSGKNPGNHWLFFGERHEAHDFFYEDFWKKSVENNQLKLSTAFSRDNAEKNYVQHRMLKEKVQLWKWLQEGAYVYICGDAEKMAKEVEATLRQIAMEEGFLSEEAAKDYVKTMRKEKRLRLDVY